MLTHKKYDDEQLSEMANVLLGDDESVRRIEHLAIRYTDSGIEIPVYISLTYAECEIFTSVEQ